jgi:hypothetical protein
MNEENLISQDKRTKSEQRKIAQQGGIASGKARREKKAMRELLEDALAKVIKSKSGEEATKKEVASIRIADGMANGDPKMLEIGLKILGDFTQKQEIEITNDQPIFNIVQKKND